MSAGASAEKQHEKLKQLSKKKEQEAFKASQDAKFLQQQAKNYELGAVGEKINAEILAKLTLDDYFILHDQQLPGLKGNVDHILIGPTGVFIINSKNWNNTTIKDNTLYVNDKKCKQNTERIFKEVNIIETLTNHEMQITPVLFFTKDVTGELKNIIVLNQNNALNFFKNLPVLYTSKQVKNTLKILLDTLTPVGEKLEPVESLKATSINDFNALAKENSKPDVDELNKHYLKFYFKPWVRYGQNRLYLNEINDTNLGFKDCKNNETTILTEKGFTETLLQVTKMNDLKNVNLNLPLMETPKGLKFIAKMKNFRKSALIGWVQQSGNVHKMHVHLLEENNYQYLGVINLKTNDFTILEEVTNRQSDTKHLFNFMLTQYKLNK